MDNVSTETIGDRIRRLRLERGMTQKELADIEALLVQRNLVNYWENDERDIKSNQIIALADFFGVTCDYLLRGVEAEHADIHKETGLRESSIQWFKEKKVKNPLYVEAFNLLFENEDNGIILANVLANSIVEVCMSKYMIYIQHNYAINTTEPQSYEYSRMMLLAMGEKRLARILERLSERWSIGTDEIVRAYLKVANTISIPGEDGTNAQETPEQ